MTSQTIIGIMGPGNLCSQTEAGLAYELGKAIALQNWVVLTGGRPAGVMAAASRGAASAGGMVLGILPDAQGSQVAQGVTVPIVTGMGHARNVINVLSCHGIVACGLGLGTVSEIALALKANKPVVMMPHNPCAQDFFEQLAPGQFQMLDQVDACIKYLTSVLKVP